MTNAFLKSCWDDYSFVVLTDIIGVAIVMIQIKSLLAPLHNKMLAKGALFSKEVKASHNIPYSHFNSESLFETREGLQGCVIKVAGISYDAVEQALLNYQQQCLSMAIQNLSDEFILYTTRHHHNYSGYPETTFPAGFANDFNEAYRAKFQNKPLFTTDLYVTLLIKPSLAKLNRLKEWSHAYMKVELAKARALQTKKLVTATQHLIMALADYQPQLLGAKETAHGPASEILSFFSPIANLEQREFLFPYQNIATFLPTKRLFFGSNTIHAVGNTKDDSHFAAILSIKEYSPQTSPGLLDTSVRLPFETIATHSFQPIAKSVALDLITKQRNRLHNVDDAAKSEIADLDQALDDLASNRISFGYHHHTLMVIAKDLKQLEEQVAKFTKSYQDCRLVITREDLNMENAFWAQLPGNTKQICRGAPISSHNFSSFCSLHNDAKGYHDQNHLGGALLFTETRNNTPFHLNLHEKASGRKDDLSKGFTTLIGPPNAGKTVLMLTLDIMFQKHGIKSYIFDRNRGCELYVRAMGGKYFRLEPGEKTGWNPCQLADTPQNRAFLRRWLQVLVTDNTNYLSATDENQIADVVDRNFTLLKSSRNLSTLTSFFKTDFAGLENLHRWLAKPDSRGKVGDYAYLFDNEQDTLSLDGNTLGFDMTYLLGQIGEDALTPVMMYLFHRIEQALDGRLTGIYLDEAWQYLKHLYWVSKIDECQVTWRKLNGFIVFATQFLDTIAKSPLSSALIQGSATNLYLPNPMADEQDYMGSFKLSAREFNLVKNSSIQSRQVLVKQGHESAIIKFDLSGLEAFIPILSGTKATVELGERIRAEVGDDPKIWLPLFNERRKYS